MSVYQDMIKSCAHFYIASDITCNKMQDYEVVCKTILAKYSNLNAAVIKYCQVQNASANKKSVKRLNPHVTFKLI